jgi:hypothetical protein
MKISNYKKVAFVGEIVTLIISISFICSIIYNYAYFSAISVALQNIPISTTDIINTAIIWSPIIIFLLFLTYFFNLFIKGTEGGKTEEEILQSSTNPEKTLEARRCPLIAIKWLGLLGLISLILFGNFNDITPFGVFTILWVFWFCPWLFSHPLIVEQTSYWLQITIIYIPILGALMFMLGYHEAISQVSQKTSNTVVYVKNSNEKIDSILMRILDRGVLIKPMNNVNITFLPWSEIKKINTLYKIKTYPGIICYLGIVCLNSSK